MHNIGQQIEANLVRTPRVVLQSGNPSFIFNKNYNATQNVLRQPILALNKMEIELYQPTTNQINMKLEQVFLRQKNINFEKVKNIYNYTPQEYARDSLYNELTRIYIDIFGQLVEIQNFIDPIIMLPLQFPSNQPIYKFVSQNLETPILSFIEKYLEELRNSPELFKIKYAQILQIVLQKTDKVFNSFYGQLNIQDFIDILFNQKCIDLVKQRDVQLIQTKAVRSAKSEIQKVDCPFAEAKTLQSVILNSIIMKASLVEDEQEQRFFMDIENPPVFHDVVVNFLTNQKQRAYEIKLNDDL